MRGIMFELGGLKRQPAVFRLGFDAVKQRLSAAS